MLLLHPCGKILPYLKNIQKKNARYLANILVSTEVFQQQPAPKSV